MRTLKIKEEQALAMVLLPVKEEPFRAENFRIIFRNDIVKASSGDRPTSWSFIENADLQVQLGKNGLVEFILIEHSPGAIDRLMLAIETQTIIDEEINISQEGRQQ
jgi:hypothetical protein